MFGLSFGEILIILVVALLVVGPSGMPKLARTLGKGLRDFRRTTGELRGAFEDEFYKLDKDLEKTVRVEEKGVEGAHVPPVEPAEGIEGVVAAPAPGSANAAVDEAGASDAIARAHRQAPAEVEDGQADAEPAGARADADAPAAPEANVAVAATENVAAGAEDEAGSSAEKREGASSTGGERTT